MITMSVKKWASFLTRHRAPRCSQALNKPSGEKRASRRKASNSRIVPYWRKSSKAVSSLRSTNEIFSSRLTGIRNLPYLHAARTIEASAQKAHRHGSNYGNEYFKCTSRSAQRSARLARHGSKGARRRLRSERLCTQPTIHHHQTQACQRSDAQTGLAGAHCLWGLRR